jgi:hypothetical protein
MTDKHEFDVSGYLRIDNLIDDASISIISQYLENKIHRGIWKPLPVMDSEPTSYRYYADPLIEVMLSKCKEAIEEAIGRTLLPTYSYVRVYLPGEKLGLHVDRPACEISVTVNVAAKGDTSPMYTIYKNHTKMHMLNPGDALVYKGCEVGHCRDTLNDDQLLVQFMLHYVDKDGANKQYANDKRPSLGYDQIE